MIFEHSRTVTDTRQPEYTVQGKWRSTDGQSAAAGKIGGSSERLLVQLEEEREVVDEGVHARVGARADDDRHVGEEQAARHQLVVVGQL